MGQDLISVNFSLGLFLVANPENIQTYIGNLLILWRLPFNIQQMRVLEKGVTFFLRNSHLFIMTPWHGHDFRITVPLQVNPPFAR